MDRVRLGIIGAGIMGERLLRAALDHAQDSVAIAGVWDPSEAAMGRIGAALPSVERAGSAEALIGASDCVYVASPPASHLPHAEAALAAGRAVFCEKPLSIDVPGAYRFVEKWQSARMAVNFPFASSPSVDLLRLWIEDGMMGAPRGFVIETHFAAWPRPWQRDAASWLDGREQGGFTREVVSHFLFLSRRLLGPLTLGTRAATFGPTTERAVEARLTAGGVPGILRGGVGTTERDDTNSWTLNGVGSVRLRDWSIPEKQAPDGNWRASADAVPNERMRPLVLARQLDGVVRMTRGEPHRLATLTEALEVQEVVEGLLAGD